MKREKQSKRAKESVQPQSFKLDVEQVPSMVSNDSTHSNNGKNMSKKFDFNSLVAAEKQQSFDDHAEYQKVLRESRLMGMRTSVRGTRKN